MFKHWMEIMHNHDNGYLDRLFHQNAFPLRTSIMSVMAKDSRLRNYFEVHSLSSDQFFLLIQLKIFSKFSGWSFNFFLLLNCIIVYFRYY